MGYSSPTFLFSVDLGPLILTKQHITIAENNPSKIVTEIIREAFIVCIVDQ